MENTANKNLNWQDLGLSKSLFWDIDASLLDLEKNARTVIERVMTHGTWEEFKAILNYYGKPKVLEVLLQLRYLDKRTLSFSSVYFDTPIEQFRCYIWKQSNPTHWDY